MLPPLVPRPPRGSPVVLRTNIPERNRRIMRRIRDLGVTAASVSRRAGYSSNSIYRISSGQVPPEATYRDFETALDLEPWCGAPTVSRCRQYKRGLKPRQRQAGPR